MHVPLVEDIGSGCLVEDFADEPSVQASIAAGVDLVCFSGDKLLGGPQAGIIAGRQALVDRLRTHPLMRAVRADKLTFAVLEATLAEYAAGRSKETVPVQQMLHASADADRIASAGARGDARGQRMAGRAAERLVGGRRRQRAGTATADGAARRSRVTASRPIRPSGGSARSTRR